MTYKAMQDPTVSPLKKPKIECASDDIIQEVSFTNDIRKTEETSFPDRAFEI